MASIVSSTYSAGQPQLDGRVYITERHLLDDGRSVDFDYLADQTINPQLVMTERAARLSAELQVQDAAILEASNGVLPLTHHQFRKLLSVPEQLIFDNFNVPEFASTHPKISTLTVEQRAYVRMGIATFRDALDIRLSDPDTQTLIGMLSAYGLLDNPARAGEILNG